MHLPGRFAWWIFSNITNQLWFEVFIMLNIFLVAVATVLDLENRCENVNPFSHRGGVSKLAASLFIAGFLQASLMQLLRLPYFFAEQLGIPKLSRL